MSGARAFSRFSASQAWGGGRGLAGAAVLPRPAWIPVPVVVLGGPRLHGPCRLLNVAVAALGLVLAVPLMLVIAIVIKVTSPGPVFFTQTRIGIDRRRARPSGNHRRSADLGGKPFTLYKFRTMVAGGEHRSGAVWARPDDPRITPPGRILRKYRLDELPQLINVLLGDMNVVGPRPEQPEIFTQLREDIRGYGERQRVPPGITGWAQVHNGYDRSIEDVRRKLRFDLEYVERRSVLLDLEIMLRTLPVMLFKQNGW